MNVRGNSVTGGGGSGPVAVLWVISDTARGCSKAVFLCMAGCSGDKFCFCAPVCPWLTVSGFIVWGYGVSVRLCMITIDNAGGLSYGPPVFIFSVMEERV